MLELISDLPDNVVGVQASGKVTSDDYENVLVPAVDAARAASPGGKVRMLYVVGSEFPDYSAGAAWEDTKVGLRHVGSWERIAIVGDADWLRHAIHAFGWVMLGEVKMFSMAERDAATAWITS